MKWRRMAHVHCLTRREVLLPDSTHQPLSVVGHHPVLLPSALQVNGHLLAVRGAIANALLDSLWPMGRGVSEGMGKVSEWGWREISD